MAKEPEAAEQYLSRDINLNRNGVSVTTNWFVFNTDDPLVALGLLPAIGSFYTQEGRRLPARLDNIDLTPTENQNPKTMVAVLEYVPLSGADGQEVQPTENVATWTMSIASETINKQQAIAQVNYPLDGGKPVKPYLTIGETEDGVDGVDILSPTSTLKIVHWLNQSKTTPKFLDDVHKIATKTNKKDFDGPWGSWKAGEVLYMGAEVSTVEGNLIQLTHTFHRSIGGKVDVVFLGDGGAVQSQEADKSGWDYLWSKFGAIPNQENQTGKTTLGPISAHIAQVYKSISFDGLKLPEQFVGGRD